MLHVSVHDQAEIDQMIDSREWWILVGNNQLFEDIEQKFYTDAPKDFVTVMGPTPKKFREMFTAGMMVLHFAHKRVVSPDQLEEFVRNYPDRDGNFPFPHFRPNQDIIFLVPSPVSE